MKNLENTTNSHQIKPVKCSVGNIDDNDRRKSTPKRVLDNPDDTQIINYDKLCIWKRSQLEGGTTYQNPNTFMLENCNNCAGYGNIEKPNGINIKCRLYREEKGGSNEQ